MPESELCKISGFGINTFKPNVYFMHHHQVWRLNVYLLSRNEFVFCYGSQNSEYFLYSIKWLLFNSGGLYLLRGTCCIFSYHSR
jgi:hypothetical protein